MSTRTFTEGGKGRKQCPRCKVYVASVSAACINCHHLFENLMQAAPIDEVPVRAPKKAAPGPVIASGKMEFVRIPDGPNPVPLKGRDKATLLAWAEEVRKFWLLKGRMLMREGLCYYLQWEDQFDDHPRLLEAACQVINDNLDDVKPETTQS